MFERFTERARQVVVYAQDEARNFRHPYIGTEHLLLGLLREEEGMGARVLEGFDVTIHEARAQVARIVGRGDETISGMVPFTPRAKKALERALREAVSLGDRDIRSEHILLGIVAESEGVATRILLDFDADPGLIREEVTRGVQGPEAPRPRGGPLQWTTYAPASRGLIWQLVAGWLLFAVALAVGLLVGWVIWGA